MMVAIIRKTRTFFKNPWVLAWKLLSLTSDIWTDEAYIKLCFFFHIHKWINLKNPKTFAEKIQWLKLHDRNAIYPRIVDKSTVKEYVANIIGEKYIIPTIIVYDSIDDICIENLPNQFVLKTTHGGGASGVVICKDKSHFEWEFYKKKLKSAFLQDPYRSFREWPYKFVSKRFIAEVFLDTKEDLKDYKFYCFNGKPLYCQVISGRAKNETIDFFNNKWEHQPFVGLHWPPLPNAEIVPEKPACYDEMLEIATKLSVDIPFVRVDLYQVDGHPYFGEMTFYPYAGLGSFYPEEWNIRMGDLLVLPKNNIK